MKTLFKTLFKYSLIAVLLSLIFGSSVTLALAQSVVDFYLVQFSGVTNDTTITIKAQNNPIIYHGNFYWWPQNGTNIQTTNGFAAMTLIPSKYTVSVAGVPQSWTITVTNSATPLNAINLTTSMVIYNGINSLSGPVVSNDGHGNYTVTGGSGTITPSQITQAGATLNEVLAWSGSAWAPAAASGGSGITQLTGDVTAGPGSGSQAATVVQVGGLSAANVASGATAANGATTAATAGTIAKRDGSGNLTANQFLGNATTATTAGLASTATQAGSVTGSQAALINAIAGAATSVAVNSANGLTNSASLTGNALTINIGQTNLWPLTNLMVGGGTVNCSIPSTTLNTNANFVFALPGGIQPLGYNLPFILVHNTSGSLITMGFPANVNVTGGAENVTNWAGVLWLLVAGSTTNATIIQFN